MERFIFTAGPEDDGVELKKLVKQRFRFSSRFMTKVKYQDLLRVDGQPAPGWHKAAQGQVIEVLLPEEGSHFEPQDIPISILYEDEDLLFIDKQPGVTVHPTKGHPDGTVANGLMKLLRERSDEFKIRFVNRLDMDTSGVLLVAKNSHAQAELNRQMNTGETCKLYYAVCSGFLPEDEFTIDAPIGSPFPGSKSRAVIEGGYPSTTEVRVLRRFPPVSGEITSESGLHTFSAEGASLAEIRLLTGRTHQIRVHFAYIGHPLLGDPLYGGDTSVLGRQALHAHSFSCLRPITKERLTVESPLPEDITEMLRRLEA